MNPMHEILATHEWPSSQTDAGAVAPVAVLVHGATGWGRTWWRVMAAEDRSVFVGVARRQLRATLPAHARFVEVDAGHTVHRDRFDEYIAAVSEWIEA